MMPVRASARHSKTPHWGALAMLTAAATVDKADDSSTVIGRGSLLAHLWRAPLASVRRADGAC
jgi:hypothetical protein